MSTLLTDRRRALVSTAPRLATLLDMLSAPAYMCDREGRLTYFNAPAQALWGRAPRLDDLAERYCGSHRLYTAQGEPLRHDECWMARALHDGCEYEGREIQVERPDGSRRFALAHARPVRDEHGVVTGGVNVMIDITGQKTAEAELRASNQRKDAFLATLAHELRNPLAPLRCAVPILRRTYGEGDATPVLAMVERQVDHLVHLVDDLVEASRITRGQLKLRPQRIDVGSVLGLAAETARPRITARGHALQMETLAEPAWIHGDPLRLAQVFANLLDNAAKFMAPGGTIEVLLRRSAAQVEIHVRDTGVGIPEASLPHVFDLFMQEERVDNGMQAGLGVGLALVRKLVELHGGSVSAHSAGRNAGSEFVVRLPLLGGADAGTREANGSERGTPADGRQRVLIVDDNRDAAQSLAMLVELLGNSVTVSFDGRDALVRAAQFQPTVVLLDLSMPGMSGFDVARELRASPGFGPVRLVALSGRSEDEYRRRSAAAGFDSHLVKPIDLPTLQKVLAPGDTP